MTHRQHPHRYGRPPAPHPSPTRPPAVWPWVLALVVLVVVTLPVTLAYGRHAITQWQDSREVTVTMEVTGSASTGRVEVDRGNGSQPDVLGDVDVPWSTTFTVTGTD